MEAWLQELVVHLSYVGVAVALIASGMGLPIPEDIPLIIGGLLCAQDHAKLYVMIPLGIMCVLTGDLILFSLGRRYGHHVPNIPLLGRFLNEKRLLKAEAALSEHAGKTLFCSRFVPGVRAAVWFSSGVLRVPVWRFLLFDGMAACISAPALILLGYFGGTQIDELRRWIGGTQLLIATVIVLAGVVFFLYLRFRKQAPLPPATPPRLPLPRRRRIDDPA